MSNQNETFIESFKQMWGNYPEAVFLLDENHLIVAVNKAAEGMGITPGINCFTLNQTDKMCKGCKAPLMRKTGTAQRKVAYTDGLGVMDGYWIPVDGSEGLYIHFGNNITEWVDPCKFPQIVQNKPTGSTCS